MPKRKVKSKQSEGNVKRRHTEIMTTTKLVSMEGENGNGYFNLLPNETLQLIFSFLSLESAGVVGQVSKLLCMAAQMELLARYPEYTQSPEYLAYLELKSKVKDAADVFFSLLYPYHAEQERHWHAPVVIDKKTNQKGFVYSFSGFKKATRTRHLKVPLHGSRSGNFKESLRELLVEGGVFSVQGKRNSKEYKIALFHYPDGREVPVARYFIQCIAERMRREGININEHGRILIALHNPEELGLVNVDASGLKQSRVIPNEWYGLVEFCADYFNYDLKTLQVLSQPSCVRVAQPVYNGLPNNAVSRILGFLPDNKDFSSAYRSCRLFREVGKSEMKRRQNEIQDEINRQQGEENRRLDVEEMADNVFECIFRATVSQVGPDEHVSYNDQRKGKEGKKMEFSIQHSPLGHDPRYGRSAMEYHFKDWMPCFHGEYKEWDEEQLAAVFMQRLINLLQKNSMNIQKEGLYYCTLFDVYQWFLGGYVHPLQLLLEAGWNPNEGKMFENFNKGYLGSEMSSLEFMTILKHSKHMLNIKEIIGVISHHADFLQRAIEYERVRIVKLLYGYCVAINALDDEKIARIFTQSSEEISKMREMYKGYITQVNHAATQLPPERQPVLKNFKEEVMQCRDVLFRIYTKRMQVVQPVDSDIAMQPRPGRSS